MKDLSGLKARLKARTSGPKMQDDLVRYAGDERLDRALGNIDEALNGRPPKWDPLSGRKFSEHLQEISGPANYVKAAHSMLDLVMRRMEMRAQDGTLLDLGEPGIVPSDYDAERLYKVVLRETPTDLWVSKEYGCFKFSLRRLEGYEQGQKQY